MNFFKCGLEALAQKELLEASKRYNSSSYVKESHNCSSTDATGKRRKFKVNELINYIKENNIPTTQVKLTDIRSWIKNTNPWHKKDTKFGIQDMAKHFKKVMAADTQYPLILSPEKSLLDGYHRLCKHVMEGKTEVPCVILDKWPEEIATVVEKGTEGFELTDTQDTESIFIEE